MVEILEAKMSQVVWKKDNITICPQCVTECKKIEFCEILSCRKRGCKDCHIWDEYMESFYCSEACQDIDYEQQVDDERAKIGELQWRSATIKILNNIRKVTRLI